MVLLHCIIGYSLSMLVQFSVENFLSFNEEQVFSMVASIGDQHSQHLVPDVPRKGDSLLRGAAIYGANAAGKSNLVQAMLSAQKIILEGTVDAKGIKISPFKLSGDNPRPSKIEFIIQSGNVLYNYGFHVDADCVYDEWLYATPHKQEVLYFQRTTTPRGQIEVEFGASFKGRSKSHEHILYSLTQDMAPNQLFLTKVALQNVAEVIPLHDWFETSLVVIPTDRVEMNLAHRVAVGPDFANFLGVWLREAGIGVERVEIRPDAEPIDLTGNFPAYNEAWRGFVRQQMLESRENFPGRLLRCLGADGEPSLFRLGEDGQWYHAPLRLWHRTASGREVPFDMAEQSDGTRRLMDLISTLYQMRQLPGQVVVIDELDRRLHPLLSRLFVQTALECDAEHRHSQLIFTTHDTTLLDLDLLRRDELWFVEKDRGGASHVYSLAEFKVRPDLKIEKGYLNGRFGAIPFIGDFSRLAGADDAAAPAPVDAAA